MPDMVSLERTPREQKVLDKEWETPKPYFPQTLHLGDEEVKKLKLSGVKDGDTFLLVAKVKVTGQSSSSHNGQSHESVTLALTEACVEAPSAEKKSDEERAKSIYTKMG